MDGRNVSSCYQLGRKECQQKIPWFDSDYWTNLSDPNDNQLIHMKNKITVPKLILIPPTLNISHNHKPPAKSETPCYITRIYFSKWKSYTQKSKETKEDLQKQMEQKKKLSIFLDALRERKKKLREELKSFKSKSTTNISYGINSHEHRFEAQQNIIEFQKLKLVKQEKIIEQLKLGKLDEELNQSIVETEKDIKEAFLKCSTRLKHTTKPILQSLSAQNIISLYPTSSKAPKIVQEMENRAQEREQRRQLILERKRILEQKKMECVQMEIERKKTQDEQVRKENLRAIKEHRKKELEHQQMIKIKKQEFFEKCMKADCFYKKKLKEFGFKTFSRLIIIKYINIHKSDQFYETFLRRKSFNNWIQFISNIYDKKFFAADELYNFKMLNKMFNTWLNTYTKSIQNLQVAEDLYEMQLQSKIFIHWHRYTCSQYVLQTKHLQKAKKHYMSRILLHYFYQWRSLPAVLKIEKAKEEKKQRWREKVWEILPDYNPIIED